MRVPPIICTLGMESILRTKSAQPNAPSAARRRLRLPQTGLPTHRNNIRETRDALTTIMEGENNLVQSIEIIDNCSFLSTMKNVSERSLMQSSHCYPPAHFCCVSHCVPSPSTSYSLVCRSGGLLLLGCSNSRRAWPDRKPRGKTKVQFFALLLYQTPLRG